MINSKQFYIISIFVIMIHSFSIYASDCHKTLGLKKITNENFTPQASVNISMISLIIEDSKKADKQLTSTQTICIENYFKNELPFEIDSYLSSSGCLDQTKDLADCNEMDQAHHVLNIAWETLSSLPDLSDAEKIKRADNLSKGVKHPRDEAASMLRQRRNDLNKGLKSYQNKYNNISHIFNKCSEESNEHIEKTIAPLTEVCFNPNFQGGASIINDLDKEIHNITKEIEESEENKYNKEILRGVSDKSIRSTLQAIWSEKAYALGSDYFYGDCDNMQAHISQGRNPLKGQSLSTYCQSKKMERAKAAICSDSGAWRFKDKRWKQKKSTDILGITRVSNQSQTLDCNTLINDSNGSPIKLDDIIEQEFLNFDKNLKANFQPSRRKNLSYYEKDMDDYNQIISSFNSHCEEIYTKADKEKNRIDNRLNFDSYGDMSSGLARNTRIRSAKEKLHDPNYLFQVYGEDNMNKIKAKHSSLVMSKIGARLLRVPEFAKKRNFSGLEQLLVDCANKKGHSLKPIKNVEEIMSAEDKLLAMQHDGLKNSIETNQDTTKLNNEKLKERMEEFLRYHPLPMLEFLKERPSDKYALSLCSHMQQIASDDRMWEVIDNTLAPVGALASVALIVGSGGALSPLVFATATALTTADIARSGFKIFDASNKSQQLLHGLSQMEVDNSNILNKLEENIDLNQTISDETVNMALNLTGGAFGINDAADMAKFLKNAKKVGWENATSALKIERKIATNTLEFTNETAGDVRTLQQKIYDKTEINTYFENTIQRSAAQKKVWDDFQSDFYNNYPNASQAQADELRNMMYNVHKNCNQEIGVSICKQRLLVTMRNHIRDTYPNLDSRIINRMADENVKILGEDIPFEAMSSRNIRKFGEDVWELETSSKDPIDLAHNFNKKYEQIIEQRSYYEDLVKNSNGYEGESQLKAIDVALKEMDEAYKEFSRIGKIDPETDKVNQIRANIGSSKNIDSTQLIETTGPSKMEEFESFVRDVSSKVKKLDDIPSLDESNKFMGTLNENIARIDELETIQKSLKNNALSADVQPKAFGEGVSGETHTLLEDIEKEIGALQRQNSIIREKFEEIETMISDSKNKSFDRISSRVEDYPDTKAREIRIIEEQIKEIEESIPLIKNGRLEGAHIGGIDTFDPELEIKRLKDIKQKLEEFNP